MTNPLIGLIAEDDSDIECIKIMTRKILEGRQVGFKKFVGHGCGKISRKANAWAIQFKRCECNSIILVHDRDRNQADELRKRIELALNPCPIENYLISIPVEELEAWLLSDEGAIKETFGLKKKIALPTKPEEVVSPKEFLGELIKKESEKKMIYLNTEHNKKIVEKIDITKILKKCPSFGELHTFISNM